MAGVGTVKVFGLFIWEAAWHLPVWNSLATQVEPRRSCCHFDRSGEMPVCWHLDTVLGGVTSTELLAKFFQVFLDIHCRLIVYAVVASRSNSPAKLSNLNLVG